MKSEDEEIIKVVQMIAKQPSVQKEYKKLKSLIKQWIPKLMEKVINKIDKW